MKNDYDVIVAGAGPAGSSAARSLAEKGVRVALLERAKIPRYKACGAAIVGRAMRIMPTNVRQAVERECFTAELNMLDAGLQFIVTREEPLVFMSMRDKLDGLLSCNAVNAGAELLEECNALNVTSEDGAVRVVTNRGSLSASFVIAADGAAGSLAKKGGWRETRTLAPAVEWEVPVDEKTLERFAGRARFDFGLVPSGYAWIFPKGSHLSVGAATLKRSSVNLAAGLEKHLVSLGIPLTDGITRHGAVASSRPRSDTLMRGRILLVGDAAGLADPVTGEGISFAVMSGQAAAASLVGGEFEEKGVREIYEATIEEEILKELRPALDVAKLLYGPAAIRNYLFRHKGQEFCEAITDVIAGKAKYSELVSQALAYARRVLVPGATGIFSGKDSV